MKRLMLPLAAAVFAACAAWRSASTPAAPPRGPIPEAPPERRAAALFYSDLGPDTVDVSGYPPERRRDYAVYAKTCSRCHTLARSINAPYVSRGWWEFYTASMRARANFHGEPLTKEEVRSVLDFLEYDSNQRKAGRAPEFEELKTELKRRFDGALDERMERLQKQPQLLSP